MKIQTIPIILLLLVMVIMLYSIASPWFFYADDDPREDAYFYTYPHLDDTGIMSSGGSLKTIFIPGYEWFPFLAAFGLLGMVFHIFYISEINQEPLKKKIYIPFLIELGLFGLIGMPIYYILIRYGTDYLDWTYSSGMYHKGFSYGFHIFNGAFVLLIVTFIVTMLIRKRSLKNGESL